MPEFIAEGSLDEVVKQMIDRFAVGQYGKDYGLRAGENLVNSEILQIQAFQGLTGQFDQQIGFQSGCLRHKSEEAARPASRITTPHSWGFVPLAS